MSKHLGIGRPSGQGRHPRQSSGAYAQVFDPQQMQTFKEAFNLIDQDSDGFISEEDLIGMLTSLGSPPSPAQLAALLSARPSSATPSTPSAKGINFTAFVTMMSEQLSFLDGAAEIKEAFASFDADDAGLVDAKVLRKYLKEEGDCMTDEEIDRLLNGPFLDKKGRFDYNAFCSTLRVTDADEPPAQLA